MEKSDDKNAPANTLVRAMRSTTGRESTTFGFSILVTVTYGLTNSMQGPPTVSEIFLYGTGAVLSFTLLEGVLSRGFRHPMPQHRTEILALGTSLNLVSVLAGMAMGLLVATVLPDGFAWILAPFAASVVYLLLESVETAGAELLQRRRGNAEADEMTP